MRLFELPGAEPERFSIPNAIKPVLIYRNALDLEDIELLQGFAVSMVDEKSAGRALRDRGFYSSPILPVNPEGLSETATEILGLGHFTVRVNVQAPGKSQGWHRDYRPEAAVLYPEGEGVIDVNPNASNLKEARHPTGFEDIITIPVHPGDIAIVGCGQDIFHRGRNIGQEVRRTIVLHDVPVGSYPLMGF